MSSNGHDDHVGLLAGHRADGSPFIEVVPARRLGPTVYKVLGTPGIAQGCATGDEILVEPDGSHLVQRRGGNVAVQVYARESLSAEDLDGLRTAFAAVGGIVEAPPNGRFAVVTVHVDAGFPAIEAAIQGWSLDRTDVEWQFGNVYDDSGKPLNWWT